MEDAAQMQAHDERETGGRTDAGYSERVAGLRFRNEKEQDSGPAAAPRH
jgi:hypothetical protein